MRKFINNITVSRVSNKAIFITSSLMITLLFSAIILLEAVHLKLSTTTILATSALFIPAINVPINWYFNYIKANRPLITVWKNSGLKSYASLSSEKNILKSFIWKGDKDTTAKFKCFEIEFHGVEKGISNVCISYSGNTRTLSSVTNGTYWICVDEKLIKKEKGINIIGEIQPTGEKFFVSKKLSPLGSNIKFLSQKNYLAKFGNLKNFKKTWHGKKR